MALAGLSKSLIAVAASLLVALTGFAAVAATPGFAVKEEILSGTTSTQTKSLAPNGTATITVTVSRTNPDQTRPGMLTLNFTLPSGVDFVSVAGCTLPSGFNPSTDQPYRRRQPPVARTTRPGSEREPRGCSRRGCARL